ncbi:MAG: ammonium transporter, Amt family, partial [Gaiellales bacterium]|nr:ammonium transporter, Amt family [Gaiellales bacterium]
MSAEQLQAMADMKIAIDTVWVVVAACMVFLMQAGFAMLEVGFSRGKNVGAVVAKILVNLSIGTFAFWAVGFALAFGGGNKVLGLDGFFLHNSAFDSLSFSAVPLSAKFLFEVVFCTVSLAIVWGTMLDRTKFGVYLVFAVAFSALIYPLVGHWIWGGGFLAGLGMQDFAGSTVVHLCGATAALAGTLLLGPRIGKFDRAGKAHPIPGHSMPLAVLGVLILWFGWFGFNPGSTLAAAGARFADIAVTTNLAAAAGVLGAVGAGFIAQRTIDVGFAGNGAIAGLVAITAPCAYVDDWAAAVIGLVAGALMVTTVIAVDRIRVDDPIGAIAGHGMGGIWGTLSCGLFATPAL